MKIFIPLAGPTPFFPKEEYPFPKPLIEIGSRMMIHHVVENLKGLSDHPHFVFITMRDEALEFSYESIFSFVTDGRSDTVLLRNPTAGALCSCLLAIDHIDMEDALVIANGDQIIDVDLQTIVAWFNESGADAGVITFPSSHPRWSYVRVEHGEVVEASEKRVISRSAVAGLYWFRRGRDFVDAAKKSIFAEEAINGNFYTAPCLNHFVLAGKLVVAFDITSDRYHSFYLPTRIAAYEQEVALRNIGRRHNESVSINVVIPAAGEGSRFANAGWQAPKPFIDIAGKAMIEAVLENVVTPDSKPICIVRKNHLDAFPGGIEVLRRRNAIVLDVDALTEGTACTILLARKYIDCEVPLLVANSEQIVDFDCQEFLEDARRRSLDGSILVFRDPSRNPKWSFAAVNERGYVTEVAEKVPISDLATVGLYYFARGSEFVRAALDMIVANDRVNHEFYTCPVYNYLIRDGLRVGVYEVSANRMNGLGTPDDLQSYIIKYGLGQSKHAPLGHG